MGSSSYIKLEYNDYGYEIYAINKGKKYKLNKQNKILMHRILKKFKGNRISDTTYVFLNYKLITLYFSKERLMKRFLKVNRGKSKRIIAGFLLAVTLFSGAKVASSNRVEDSTSVDSGSEIVIDVTSEPDVTLDDNNLFVAELNEFVYEEDFVNLDSAELNEDVLETENTFCYEYSSPNDKAALENAENYMDLFLKYESMYGIDAKLLCAIGAQESSGIHHSESRNGGYATGLMGIENIWANGEIIVFNFDTNSYEKIVVDYSRIGDIDYNIKIGAAIFQNYFYSTLRNNDMLDVDEQLAFTLQKYNMGPGNMSKVLGYGGNWIDNREMINAGDKNYFEHVLSRLDNDTFIKIRLDDGSYHETKLVNMALEQNITRS